MKEVSFKLDADRLQVVEERKKLEFFYEQYKENPTELNLMNFPTLIKKHIDYLEYLAQELWDAEQVAKEHSLKPGPTAMHPTPEVTLTKDMRIMVANRGLDGKLMPGAEDATEQVMDYVMENLVVTEANHKGRVGGTGYTLMVRRSSIGN